METSPLVVPLYAFGTRLLRVADLVAESPTFRQRTQTATREEALDHIQFPFLRFRTPQDVDAYYGGITGPAAVIEGESVEWGCHDVAGAIHLRLLIVDFDRHPDDPSASIIDFCNFLEGTVADVYKACQTGELPRPKVAIIMPTLDNGRRAGKEGGHWLGGADLMWEALSPR